MREAGDLADVLDVVGDRRRRAASAARGAAAPASPGRRRRSVAGRRPARAARPGTRRPSPRSAWSTNGGTKVTMHTPPLPASDASTSSGTLRGWSQTARAELWLKITGAVVTVERVAHHVGGDVREVDEHAEPVHLADHVAAEVGEPAEHRLVGRGVGPRARSRCGSASCSARRGRASSAACRARSRSSGRPPCRSARRSGPPRSAASTSSAVRHRARSSGNASTRRCTKSICSRVAVTASSPVSEQGTKTDQNWPATPPARSRGRSVCTAGSPPARSTADEVVAAVLAQRPGQVVVPVEDGDGGPGHRPGVTGVFGRDSGTHRVNRSARYVDRDTSTAMLPANARRAIRSTGVALGGCRAARPRRRAARAASTESSPQVGSRSRRWSSA